MIWPVMPICDAQLQDVNPNDILNDGLYRRCNTYKGGGGYDRFPEIYQKRFGARENLNDQFVVQLRGCPLNCPYCYVTRKGVWGSSWESISTFQLIKDFRNSKCEVFHLMGGAPAIYINHWIDIIEQIPDKIFHSDLMLIEHPYDPEVIQKLAQLPNCLHALSIKGYDTDEWMKNTRTAFNLNLMNSNLDILVQYQLPFYFTFTGMSRENIELFKQHILNRYSNPKLLDDSFAIDIVHYKALDYESSDDN